MYILFIYFFLFFYLFFHFFFTIFFFFFSALAGSHHHRPATSASLTTSFSPLLLLLPPAEEKIGSRKERRLVPSTPITSRSTLLLVRPSSTLPFFPLPIASPAKEGAVAVDIPSVAIVACKEEEGGADRAS